MSRSNSPCRVPAGFTVPDRPNIETAAAPLLEHSTGRRVAVPLPRFSAWFTTAPLETLLPGSGSLPAVIGTAPLTSAPFPEPGSRRLVCLADGGSAVEEVLGHTPPHGLRYLVWGYTTAAAAPIAYGIGQFRFTAEEDATRILWTYGFRLKADRFPGNLGALGRGMFRLAFLDRTYARFMESGLDAIEREALAAR